MQATEKKKTNIKNKFEYISPLEAVHETAHGLYDAGVIDATIMREFDALCLPPVKDFHLIKLKKFVYVKN